MKHSGLGRALELIEARGAAAQICVHRNGKLVLDRAINCAPQSLFWIFSASKPFVAMLVYLLAERGQLRLDDPVAAHWPEFGRNGKDKISIRMVLQHRSGLPTAGGALGDAMSMADWDRSVRRIERARPIRTAGRSSAYQFISFGFILGELVQRVSGVSVDKFLAAEILEPLRMRDTFLGLPDAEWPRHVPVRFRNMLGRPVQFIVNRRETRQAVIPAAGISTTARDLAVFYQMLLNEGEFEGRRILQPASIREARTSSNNGEWDPYAFAPIRWAQGLQLGGPRPDKRYVSPMGRLSSPLAFGHNGSNCCIGWADPTRQLAFAYLTNLLTSPRRDARHLTDVADAIIGACADQEEATEFQNHRGSSQESRGCCKMSRFKK
jgi:CubicO group peptidase (beta-lactamase class C family)